MMFEMVPCRRLTGRQKENRSFHKVAARPADFGYTSTRLSDDLEGADIIALHCDGESFLKIQLKARLTVDREYAGKKLYIAFRDGERVFVYSHDTLLDRVLDLTDAGAPASWRDRGYYSWPHPGIAIMGRLAECEV